MARTLTHSAAAADGNNACRGNKEIISLFPLHALFPSAAMCQRATLRSLSVTHYYYESLSSDNEPTWMIMVTLFRTFKFYIVIGACDLSFTTNRRRINVQ